MSPRRLMPYVAVAMLLVTGCKAPAPSAVLVAFPQPVPPRAAGEEPAYTEIGILGAGGGQRVVVDLSRPDAGQNTGHWNCYSLPDPKLVLGRARCVGQTSLTMDLTAAAADFVCRKDLKFGELKATSPLPLIDCPAWALSIRDFDPSVQIRVDD